MKRFYWILFLLLLVANILIYKDLYAPSVLEVSVLDVGKGDAVLVQTPSGKTLLIDTGPDASILRALGAALPFWQRNIDLVIITSKAAGSAGGLTEVTNRYRIGTLIRSSARGERLTIGDGVYLDILWPPQTAAAMSGSDGALVLRLSYGATSFLIQNNLPVRASAWLAALDETVPPPDVSISSSTPTGVYTSNGKVVTLK